MTKEEILQFVSGNSKYRDIYEKILAKDSLLGIQVMNEILNEEPQDPSDLCVILDQVRRKYRTILGGEPSADEFDLKKAKIFLLLKAALVDGSINDKENDALSQMVNAYEYRVPNLDVSAVAAQYSNGRAEAILQEAKYGDRIRLLNSIDYIFKADGPLQKEEIGLMRELFSVFDIKPDALGSFNFDPKRVYGVKMGAEEPAPQKVAPQKNGQGMSRDDILETTGRIRDLQVFHNILTSSTAGAERLYEAIADLNISNPMMLTSYLLQNKDELLVYCDDEASQVRTAKTALLMFAAAVDGKSEKKDALLTDIADNKIHVYNFEWNQATNWHDEKSEWSVGAAVNILSELPLEEKVEIYNDVATIFEADGGELSERKKQNLGYLRDGLGLDGNADEDDTENEMDEGSAEEESNEVEEVEEVNEDVVESEESQAASNTGGWTCPNCGQSGNTGNFCGECGTKRPDPAGPWTCPNCGHPSNKGKFCENCGEPRDNKKNKPSPAKSVTPKKAEAAPKPQAVPAAKPVKRTATINSVKADHNVMVNGMKGVTLHINMDIDNCKGVDCKCGAWLFYADGTKVKDTNGSYRTSATDGQVYAMAPFKPIYDNCHFDDLQLFFPYDEFHIKGKDVGCYLSLRVQSDSGACISPEYRENMTYSSGDEKTVEFKKVWLTSYKNIFRVHVHFQVNHARNQQGKLTVWIYNEDGSKRMAGIYGDRTPDGQVVTERDILPESDHAEWTDWWETYFGFRHLNMPAPGTYRFKLQVGVTFDGVTVGTSDFVDFKVEYKKSLFGEKFKLI